MIFPAFNWISLDGTLVDLKEYRGKFVLLDFWGSWCLPCLVEIPELKRLKEQYGDKLVLVGMICNDNQRNAKKTIAKHAIDWVQIYSDKNEFPSRFGVRTFPTKLLLDENGVIVKVFEGTSAQVISEIEEFL